MNRRPLRRTPALIFLSCLFLCAVAPVWGKQSINQYDQLLLVRGLAHEIAVAKIPLPWGKRGIIVRPNGEIDQNEAAGELRKRGESVGPGMPVEITGIRFRGNRIVLAINGGGKGSSHWWQHVQLGLGPVPVPVASNPNASPRNGSFITVLLPPGNHDPSVEQVKGLLSEALDFSRRMPTVLYSPSLPPKYKQAIKRHQVALGMNRDDVLSAKGPPDQKVRTQKPDGSEEEDWLYGKPPHVLFVIFNYNSVVAIHQY